MASTPPRPQALRRVIPLLLLTALPAPQAASPPRWPQWRGPAFDGSAPDQKVLERFSKEEGVLWKVSMPGGGAGTPAVWDRHLFVSSADESTQTLVALSLDSETGSQRWRKEVATGVRRDDRSNFASPSPLTDGSMVWFFYSTGDLVAFTMDGTEVWRRNIQKDYGEFAFLWTYSSTPLLYDGRLYVQVVQRDVPVSGRGRKDGPNEPYLLALDPKSGRELWRQVRPSDAVQESREAFSTPIPFSTPARSEILITGGDCITGHDPATGRELWRWATWNPNRIGHWRLVPSPVAGGGVILACAPKGGPVIAVKAGGSGRLTDDGLAWRSEAREVTADVPTPLFYRGRFYILNGNRRLLCCVEPATGRVVWTGDLGGTAVFESSPTGVDGRIYCVNQKGDVAVVAAGDEFKLLHSTAMGEEGDRRVRSSVVAAGGRLYLRTDTRLYCVGAR